MREGERRKRENTAIRAIRRNDWGEESRGRSDGARAGLKWLCGACCYRCASDMKRS